jgi:hypothetical protein
MGLCGSSITIVHSIGNRIPVEWMEAAQSLCARMGIERRAPNPMSSSMRVRVRSARPSVSSCRMAQSVRRAGSPALASEWGQHAAAQRISRRPCTDRGPLAYRVTPAASRGRRRRRATGHGAAMWSRMDPGLSLRGGSRCGSRPGPGRLSRAVLARHHPVTGKAPGHAPVPRRAAAGQQAR